MLTGDQACSLTGIDQLGEYGRPGFGQIVAVVTAATQGQQPPLAMPLGQHTQSLCGMRMCR